KCLATSVCVATPHLAKNSHLTITTKPVMSGFSVYFLRMSGSWKACFYIFHMVNLQRNRTWIPENFHK
ncbi:TPA: hypothetical protein GF119_25865, partial [Escherichia coli]|nr:hypothetical protein [Escherichia coli]